SGFARKPGSGQGAGSTCSRGEPSLLLVAPADFARSSALPTYGTQTPMCRLERSQEASSACRGERSLSTRSRDDGLARRPAPLHAAVVHVLTSKRAAVQRLTRGGCGTS